MEPAQFIAQDRFNQTYITSSEVGRRLGVTRPAIHFRRKAGLLPNAIAVQDSQLFIWERDAIEPYLKKWEEHLQSKRTQNT